MASPARYPFLLSLPERALRSLGALSGGLLREIGIVVLPSGIRRTALYRTIVEVMLRFLIEEIGRVKGVYPSEDRVAENFLLKRGASHGIELLGILTIHASPVWILAALADATGGGHTLIQEIAQALKEERLLDADVRFETVDNLLGGLEKTSSRLAGTLNLPPLNIEGLWREWRELKAELPTIPRTNLPTAANLERLWAKLVASAAAQNRSVFTLCSTLALSSVAEIPAKVRWLSRAARTAAKRTGHIVGQELLDHYSESLEKISRAGLVEYGKREFRPYLQAAAEQFVQANESLTERLLRRR